MGNYEWNDWIEFFNWHQKLINQFVILRSSSIKCSVVALPFRIQAAEIVGKVSTLSGVDLISFRSHSRNWWIIFVSLFANGNQKRNKLWYCWMDGCIITYKYKLINCSTFLPLWTINSGTWVKQGLVGCGIDWESVGLIYWLIAFFLKCIINQFSKWNKA